MPDLQNYSVTPLAAASVNVPRVLIQATVVDNTDGHVIADFQGANALTFPAVLNTLSAADRLELAQLVAVWLINRKAGVG